MTVELQHLRLDVLRKMGTPCNIADCKACDSNVELLDALLTEAAK